jgi:hypothetical protein
MDMDAAPNYVIPPVRTSQVCHFKIKLVTNAQIPKDDCTCANYVFWTFFFSQINESV